MKVAALALTGAATAVHGASFFKGDSMKAIGSMLRSMCQPDEPAPKNLHNKKDPAAKKFVVDDDEDVSLPGSPARSFVSIATASDPGKKARSDVYEIEKEQDPRKIKTEVPADKEQNQDVANLATLKSFPELSFEKIPQAENDALNAHLAAQKARTWEGADMEKDSAVRDQFKDKCFTDINAKSLASEAVAEWQAEHQHKVDAERILKAARFHQEQQRWNALTRPVHIQRAERERAEKWLQAHDLIPEPMLALNDGVVGHAKPIEVWPQPAPKESLEATTEATPKPMALTNYAHADLVDHVKSRLIRRAVLEAEQKAHILKNARKNVDDLNAGVAKQPLMLEDGEKDDYVVAEREAQAAQAARLAKFEAMKAKKAAEDAARLARNAENKEVNRLRFERETAAKTYSAAQLQAALNAGELGSILYRCNAMKCTVDYTPAGRTKISSGTVKRYVMSNGVSFTVTNSDGKPRHVKLASVQSLKMTNK